MRSVDTSVLRLSVLAAATLALAGCAGSGGGPAPTVTVTVTATQTVTASPTPSESAAAEPSPEGSAAAPSSGDGPVTSVVKFVRRISPSGSAAADQFFELRPTFSNTGTQEITAIKGTMHLADPFGTEVFTGSWKATGLGIAPGSSYTQKGYGFTVEGSTGSPGCEGGLADFRDQSGLCAAADAKFVDYAWTFDPESVKFADGTFWP